MSELAPGTRIGPYLIREVAGRGAVGVVYAADHQELDRRVAIKTLNAQLVSEETYRTRFQRETQGGLRFDHPNIINVFDAGEYEGSPYLVMTYVTGPDLERVLSDRGGWLEPAETVLICAAVAAALDAAGAEGLAHRDVKPANIMLEGWEPERYGGRRRRPHVYLTDFGLIKSSAQATLTQTGQFVGTLLYMSPEQINAGAVPASDQYSLACVMWECLTGNYPFRPTGNSMLSLINAHLVAEPPLITSQSRHAWSPEINRVFARALAKDPAARFVSCTAFVDHATQALGLGASAPRIEPAPPLAAVNSTAELERRRRNSAAAESSPPLIPLPLTPPTVPDLPLSLTDLPPVPLGDEPIELPVQPVVTPEPRPPPPQAPSFGQFPQQFAPSTNVSPTNVPPSNVPVSPAQGAGGLSPLVIGAIVVFVVVAVALGAFLLLS